MDTTYRLISLTEEGNCGQTGATAEIARLLSGNITRFTSTRLAIERTDWSNATGKLKPVRSVVIEVEDQPGQWTLGA